MKIGELSKRSGFSRDTIRFYQDLGFFEGQVRQGENNYREFSEEAVEILALIEQGKIYGFTLRENREVLRVKDDSLKKLSLMNSLVDQKVLKAREEILRLENQIKSLELLKLEIDRCGRHCS